MTIRPRFPDQDYIFLVKSPHRPGSLGFLDAVAGVEVGTGEEIPDVVGADLATVGVGVALDDAGELDLEPARHDDAVLGLHQVGDAALARLAVDADHRIVGAADVGRVDREVGH